MEASILILPVIQLRAMFIGCWASATTSSLLAVSRMSAGGSPSSRLVDGIVAGAELGHVGDAEVGDGDADRAVAEILLPVGRAELGQPGR